MTGPEVDYILRLVDEISQLSLDQKEAMDLSSAATERLIDKRSILAVYLENRITSSD